MSWPFNFPRVKLLRPDQAAALRIYLCQVEDRIRNGEVVPAAEVADELTRLLSMVV